MKLAKNPFNFGKSTAQRRAQNMSMEMLISESYARIQEIRGRGDDTYTLTLQMLEQSIDAVRIRYEGSRETKLNQALYQKHDAKPERQRIEGVYNQLFSL